MCSARRGATKGPRGRWIVAAVLASRRGLGRPRGARSRLGSGAPAGAAAAAAGAVPEILTELRRIGETLRAARVLPSVASESRRQQPLPRPLLADGPGCGLVEFRRESSVISRWGASRGRHRSSADAQSVDVNAGGPASNALAAPNSVRQRRPRACLDRGLPRQPPRRLRAPRARPPGPSTSASPPYATTASVLRRRVPHRRHLGGPALPSQRAVPTSASKAVAGVCWTRRGVALHTAQPVPNAGAASSPSGGGSSYADFAASARAGEPAAFRRQRARSAGRDAPYVALPARRVVGSACGCDALS